MASENTNVVVDDNKNNKHIDEARSASAQTFASQTPTLSGAFDDAGDIQNAMAPGGVTDDRQPGFHGLGTPGDTVLIKDNGTEIGRALVGDNGLWSFTPSIDLAEGLHAITLVARDPSGNESAASAPFNFEIDVTPPDASKLAVTGVTDAVGGITGNVLSGAATDDARPLLSGISTGTPGHTVTVIVKDSTGTHELGQATIGENGHWTFQVDSPLAAGQNTFMLVETDRAGNETWPTGRYTVNVNTDKPSAPVIDSVFDDVGAPHMLQPGEATNDAKPTLAGTAQANHIVKFYDGATFLGQAVADANGKWEFTPLTALTDGAYNITAESTNPLGQTSDASSAWNFVVDTTAPTQTATVTDIGKDSGFDADDHLTNDGSAGRLLQGKLSAALAAGETLQVSTDGGQTWKAAFVAGDTWSAQDDNSHTGDWSVQTRVIDAAGNLGAVQSQAMAMDTAAPVAATQVTVSSAGVEVRFNPANVAVGHKVSLIVREDHFDHALTAADIAAGKVLIPGFTPQDAGGLSVAISDAAGNVSPYISPPFQGRETLDNLPKISVETPQHTTSTGVAIEMVYGYIEPFDATHLYLSAKGIVNFKLPDPAKFVEIEYGNTHAAPFGKVEFYSAEGVLLGTKNMLYSPGSPDPMLKLGLSSQTPIAYIKVYSLDAGTSPGVSDAILLGDLTWSGGGQSSTSAQYQTLTDASAGTLHGGSENNVFTVTDVKHLADSALSGNAGLDTFKLSAANQVLDLTSLGHKVSAIEIIDITGTGNNALTLSLAEVLENGAVDQFVANGRVQMMVKGNAGDAVSLLDVLPNGTDPGDWVKGANVTIDGVVYEVYAHSGFKADLLVQQGVTVTLQITIDRVLDDVGAITGAIDKGGFTDDTTPTLQGKAAAGGTVKVYDGATLLGSAVADASGKWSFTPGTALSEGLHNLSATVTPAGGSESARTGVFDLTVDLNRPTATVTDIGKDSGFSADDYLTNDGGAGRLMMGQLSASLAAGETLQVSIDGGTTWKAAFVDGAKWSAQDDNSHTGDWTVQTRVVDVAGNAGPVKSQAMAMDTVAPDAPTKVVVSSGGVEVQFNSTNVVAGHKISVKFGDKYIDQILTESNIAAGKVIVSNPNSPTFLNFNSISSQPVGSVTLGDLKITSQDGLSGYKTPDGTPSFGTTGNSLLLGRSTSSTHYKTTFEFSKGKDYVSFNLGGHDGLGEIVFYDVAGNNIGSIRVLDHSKFPELFQIIQFSAPIGSEIGGFVFTSERDSNSSAIDDFQIGRPLASTEISAAIVDPAGNASQYRDSEGLKNPAASQTLTEASAGTLYGGSDNNVFTVTDVKHLADSAIAGNGGLDTLQLTGANQILDLTDLGRKVSGIEIIDLTGTGNNMLNLSLGDVMENGAVDQFVATGRVQMLVKGNAGDKVTLSDLLPNGTDPGNWVKGANVTINGVVYEVYAHSGFGADLLVQQGVTVTLQNTGAGTFHINPEAEAYVLDHTTQTYTDSDDAFIARLGFADRLEGGAGNDTFTQVGTSDVVHGGAGDDVIRVNSGDFTRIEGGLGIDTLVMDGKSMHIDLSALGMKVQGFERFDLGAGGNTLALSAADVLAGGARDMVTADGKVQMLVNGANGDVDLLGGSDGWSQGSNTTVGDVTYTVYTNLAGTAELLVEDKVHVTIM
ncbi:hypothetical protein GFK26_17160 [Variovorax paradoxus]|uniref:Bacterial Ig-like domain-containing protein n=1 Tax=Variovorax paradoxus TaxID=34073 RepID=A0A5Q0M6D8_VARPD|nr:Ig-like domain-containing protein [Variovorax paradoxus]QFZ84367.1 hypothetical protein GFK26_17160 [Variovorax paradoxus]